MTDDAISVLDLLFTTIFRLFNSWYIPGTNVTPGVAFFGILFVVFVARALGKILGLWESL